MMWQDLLIIKITDMGLNIYVGPVVGGIAIVILLLLLAKIKFNLPCGVVEAQISLPGLGHIKIKPDSDVRQIAHQAWSEIVTRKAALPFDEDHDVISEIYNSWYELFKEIRKLIRNIPASQIYKNNNTETLVNTLIIILNDGMRPHLTKWQSKYRKWFEEANKTLDKSPHEIQQEYPKYQELITDLKAVNLILLQYAQFLRDIAHKS